MGASKQEFIDVRMQMEYYQSLDKSIQDNMEVRRVDEHGWQEEYEANQEWVEQKKKTSYNEYKKLKQIEYNIRNNKK